MALRASYYGVKRNLKDELKQLDGIIPAGASISNPLATEKEIDDIWAANALTGVHQLVPMKIDEIKSHNTTGTWSDNAYTINGITYTLTVNGDGYVTEIDADGEASADWANLFVNSSFTLKKGKYKLSGSDGGAASSYRVTVLGTGSDIVCYDGDTNFTLSQDYSNLRLRLSIRYKDYDADHVKFHPLIRLAEDQDRSFTNYAESNYQLTEDIATIEGIIDDHKTEINAIISAATGAADFAAFKTAMEALTPLTRTVIALDTRSIPEEDPEPETEVKTTKRTTKKTVKEGE